ncbi:MAG: TetR family transcriptional regulator [Verrucomicrobiales bacterium]|nr:TetR family transcriptional regulator [Verrucomicrobiales bacterium]
MDAVSELIWTGSYGSTTIDQICDKAGVKKGSFYYFFESKADVAVEALEAGCGKKQTEMDKIFSATVPPLERIRKYCEFGYNKQVEMKAKYGYVLGCPLCTLGSEVSTQEQKLRERIEQIFDQQRKYLESAIRDAHAEGSINAPDAASKARMLQVYLHGLMTQARIQNELGVLREGFSGIFAMLGVKEVATVAA